MINILIMKQTPPPFELLEILIAAAEAKNFAAAAKSLGLSQGAVSLKLQQLQGNLPFPLFTVRGKKKILTSYGQEVYGYARRQRERSATAYEAFSRKYLSPEAIELSIGCRRELFEMLYPRIDFAGAITFHESSGRVAISNLLERKIDLAITYIKPDLTEVVARPIMQSACHLLVHRKHLQPKLFGKDFVRSESFLTSVPCLVYRDEGHMLSKWVEYLEIPYTSLKVKFVAEDWGMLRSLAERGYGYMIAPDFVQPTSPNVVAIPIPEDALSAYTFYAVFYKDLIQIPAIKTLVNSLTIAKRKP